MKEIYNESLKFKEEKNMIKTNLGNLKQSQFQSRITESLSKAKGILRVEYQNLKCRFFTEKANPLVEYSYTRIPE